MTFNKIKTTLSYALDILHLLFMISPFVIFFLKKSTIRPYIKWVLLITIMTPLHWKFIDNKCIITSLSNKLRDDNPESTSPFSRKYLEWLYKPIAESLNMDYNNEEDLDKIIQAHWVIIIILIWTYYFFYSLPNECR